MHMTVQFWMTYIGTLVVASLLPGPSMLLGLAHGVRYGGVRTMYTALGNAAASMLQAAAAMAGLSMLLLASASVFLFIKIGGALYLIWLGIGFLRSPGFTCGAQTAVKTKLEVSRRSMAAQGFLVAAGNPKAIIFFTALFPHFMTPETANPACASALILTLGIIAFGCMMVYALGGAKLAGVLIKAPVAKWFGRVVGTSFIGAGITVAMSDR